MTVDIARMQRLVTGWRPAMSVSVNVAELAEFVAAYVELRTRMDAVETWAMDNAEGDGLRRVLWPRKDGLG